MRCLCEVCSLFQHYFIGQVGNRKGFRSDRVVPFYSSLMNGMALTSIPQDDLYWELGLRSSPVPAERHAADGPHLHIKTARSAKAATSRKS